MPQLNELVYLLELLGENAKSVSQKAMIKEDAGKRLMNKKLSLSNKNMGKVFDAFPFLNANYFMSGTYKSALLPLKKLKKPPN